MKKTTCLMLAALVVAQCAPKKQNSDVFIQTKTVSYQQDGKSFDGFIAYPKASSKKLPAVLIIHDWNGLDTYEEMRAKKIAENGYVAFAMDMYGAGIRARDNTAAAALSGLYSKDRSLMRSRIQTALAVLKARPEVDGEKIVIIGYCFGGMAAIEAALAGQAVRGVVTFHASLTFPTLAQDAKNIHTRILIHHGGADTFVKKQDVEALKLALRNAGVKFEFVSHPGATHGFTLSTNTGGKETMGMKYDAKADFASWASLLSFLRQVFA